MLVVRVWQMALLLACVAGSGSCWRASRSCRPCRGRDRRFADAVHESCRDNYSVVIMDVRPGAPAPSGGAA